MDRPDIMLITEVIPKNRINPITHALVEGYKCYLNFNPPDEYNLGVCIYSEMTLNVIETLMSYIPR